MVVPMDHHLDPSGDGPARAWCPTQGSIGGSQSRKQISGHDTTVFNSPSFVPLLASLRETDNAAKTVNMAALSLESDGLLPGDLLQKCMQGGQPDATTKIPRGSNTYPFELEPTPLAPTVGQRPTFPSSLQPLTANPEAVYYYLRTKAPETARHLSQTQIKSNGSVNTAHTNAGGILSSDPNHHELHQLISVLGEIENTSDALSESPCSGFPSIVDAAPTGLPGMSFQGTLACAPKYSTTSYPLLALPPSDMSRFGLITGSHDIQECPADRKRPKHSGVHSDGVENSSVSGPLLTFGSSSLALHYGGPTLSQIQQLPSSLVPLSGVQVPTWTGGSVMSPTYPNKHLMQQRLNEFMIRSEETQKALQEWDKKNGLPKSHSCTMVKTSRSRRQLIEGKILPKWDGSPLIRDEAPPVKPRKKTPKKRHLEPMGMGVQDESESKDESSQSER